MIKDMYSYNEDTGELISNRTGNPLGYLGSDGYLVTTTDKVHRLVWEYHHGYAPTEIDHINKDRSDNRIENLREVTRSENMKNKSKYKNNKSGVTGVGWHKKQKRWHAGIRIDGKRIHLGSFTQYHEAVNARKNAEVLYGFTND